MSQFDLCGNVSQHPAPWRGPPYKLPDEFELMLPVSDSQQAADFVEGLGGGTIGAGRAMQQIGVDAPILRAQYKRAIESMAQEVQRRLAAGDSAESIARWASTERNRIIAQFRAGSPWSAQLIYTFRDWRKYGPGGRTWENIVARAEGKPGYPGPQQLYTDIVEGAARSNAPVNRAAMQGAEFLRQGGKVVIVVGVAATAARIWQASDAELPRLLAQESGALAGGFLGARLAIGGCIVFGIATSGWGLLACGVVGGAGGGLLGAAAGDATADGLGFSDIGDDEIQDVVIEIPADRIYADVSHCRSIPLLR